jgi:hypothetical protein
MKKLITTKNLTLVNFIIVAYFLVLYLLNYYNLDNVVIGVFRELLTIPFLLAQLVFVVIGLNYLFKAKSDLLYKLSFIFLTLSTLYNLNGFF